MLATEQRRTGMATNSSRAVYRFGDLELDVAAHQLRRAGQPLRLEQQPIELLIILVSRRGQAVSREEIVAQLWRENAVVDFDTGLNALVGNVRQALGDSADASSYIETVPGEGYRFVAPVEVIQRDGARQDMTSRQSDPAETWDRWMWPAIALLVSAGALGVLLWYAHTFRSND